MDSNVETVDAVDAKVESSEVPDDGTPNIKPIIDNDRKENGREKQGGTPNFRRGGKFGNRNENRNSGGGRRPFGGPSDDWEQGGNKGVRNFGTKREHPSGQNLGGPRDFGGQERDHINNRVEQGGWNSSEYIREKLFEMSGPTLELPPLDMKEMKFNGRNRLYVGNIPQALSEEDIQKMFSEYGEINDIFINHDKHFAFVIYDYHSNAERAKHELDGKVINNNDRQLKIRYSPKATTVKVTNLPPTVSNELLYHAFSVFGDIERAIVLIDERGRSTGTGEIDFVRKKSATQAVKECTEGCFFLTNSLRPCIAEFYEPILDTDGYSEKRIQWRNNEFLKDREVGPWLAKPDSFEFDFGIKWKQIRELYKQKEDALKKELLIEEEKLYAQMGFVKYQYETQMLKKQLEEREMYWEQQKAELEKKERMAEELRMRNDEELRRREEQIKARLVRHEEDLKLRQKEASYYQQDRQYDQRGERWAETRNDARSDQRPDGAAREGYWQREAPILADDVVSQGSRGRSTFLEEPGQVWKRLDEEGVGGGDELFQRRPPTVGEEIPPEMDYAVQGQWKRTWNEDYHYGKRGRY
ncbi:hypothetical protein HHI36_010172 [Cryptolaemus montrouzieri]|uniref:RRM domain-containing protein n=1 Tax=Cryptolaemus montrouzieri TaxID=559131 RepID=A0ABD2MI26_9CUCU